MASASDAPSLAPPIPAPLKGFRLFLAAFSVSLSYFLVMLDLTVANVAVPHIAGSLGVSTTQGTLIITSYAIAEAICLPLSGWLAKRFGTVQTFIFGLIGFAIASALCGMARSLEAIIVFRVFQGLCGAPMLPLCQTMLLRIFPPEKAGTAVALSVMTAVIGPILGPIVGGWITDNYSWRWVFYLNVPFVLLSVPLVMKLLMPFETAKIKSRIDYVGIILLAIWVGALQMMLDMGRDRDWFHSPVIVTLGLVTLIGLIAFLIWEWTDDQPVVDLRILSNRGYSMPVAILSVGYAVIIATSVMVPLWLQTTMNYTATLAGYVLAPMSVFSIIAVPLAGRLAHKMDSRYLISGGFLWMALVAFVRIQTNTDMTLGWFALPQLMQGMASAFIVLSLTVMALGAVKPHQIASAAGLLAFFRVLTMAIFISGMTSFWEYGGRVARSETVAMMDDKQAALDTFAAHGLTMTQARLVIERLVEVQASTMSYVNLFSWILAISMLASILIWVLPKAHQAKK